MKETYSESIMPSEISKKINYYNFFGACFLVMYHFNPYGWTDLNCKIRGKGIQGICRLANIKLNEMGGAAVAFFFLTSAFLLFYNMTENNISHKIINRFKSLVIPFFIWNVLYFIIFSIREIKNPIKCIEKFFLTPYCGVLWFVEMLLFLLVFVRLNLLIMKTSYINIICLIVAFICSFYPWNNKISNQGLWQVMCLDRNIGYLFSYFLGAYLAVVYREKVLNIHRNVFLETSLSILSCVTLIYYFFNNFSKINVIVPIAFWMLIPSRFFKAERRLDGIIKGKSFFIYVMHMGFISLFWNKISNIPIVANVLQSMIATYSGILFLRIFVSLGILVLCLIIIVLMQKLNPRILKIIGGGR